MEKLVKYNEKVNNNNSIPYEESSRNLSKKQEKYPDISGENRDKKGRFVPGVSGNPNGRPEGTLSLVAILKEELEKIPGGKKEEYARIFIRKYIDKAMIEGDASIMRDMINRIDGIPHQNSGLEGKNGLPEPIIVNIIDYGEMEYLQQQKPAKDEEAWNDSERNNVTEKVDLY